MATKFKVKRSTVSGVSPTTGDIDTAELAINLPDRKLFTSNGTAVYELGSNLTNLSVSANLNIGASGDIVLAAGAGISANGSLGTAGQVLTTNSTSVYWAAPIVNTSAQYAWTNVHTFSSNVNFVSNTLFINSVNNRVGIGTGSPGSRLSVLETSQFSLGLRAGTTSSQTGILNIPVAVLHNADTTNNNGVSLRFNTNDTANEEVTGAGIGAQFTDHTAGSLNADIFFYTNNDGAPAERLRIKSGGNVGISNTAPVHTLSVGGTSYFLGNSSFVGQLSVGNATHNVAISQTSIVISNGITITANGSNGTSGQVLSSNGTGIYWSTPTTSAVNTAAQYSWTNTHSFSANVTFNDTVTLTNLNSGPLAGFRNAVINGNFNIAQRGTSFVAGANNDDAYHLDRWYVLSDGNDVVDITQSTTEVPANGSQTSIALDVETTAKKFGIAQIIEQRNCQGLIGNTVTLSFKAKVSSTTKLDNVKCAIVSWSGTADTVTSDIISAWNVEGTNPTLIANATYENTPANLNVTTSWATYSVSAAVDTASTGNIIVFIWSDVTDTTAGDFLYITDVQLEVGALATLFERRSIGTELSLCQRYYQITKGNALMVLPSGSPTMSVPIPYFAVMRAAPTAVASGGVSSSATDLIDILTTFGARYSMLGTASTAYYIDRNIALSAEL